VISRSSLVPGEPEGKKEGELGEGERNEVDRWLPVAGCWMRGRDVGRC